MWRFSLIFLLIVCGFDGFFLLPDSFPVSDIGLLLILGVTFFGLLFFRRPERSVLLRQPATWLLLAYLLIVLIQVALAGFNYRQSLLSGLIAVRHQFYYLTLLLFFLLLRSTADYLKLLTRRYLSMG